MQGLLLRQFTPRVSFTLNSPWKCRGEKWQCRKIWLSWEFYSWIYDPCDTSIIPLSSSLLGVILCTLPPPPKPNYRLVVNWATWQYKHKYNSTKKIQWQNCLNIQIYPIQICENTKHITKLHVGSYLSHLANKLHVLNLYESPFANVCVYFK